MVTVHKNLITEHYESLSELFAMIQSHGFGNCDQDGIQGNFKKLFKDAEQIYKKEFSDKENKLTNTLEASLFIGYKQHQG